MARRLLTVAIASAALVAATATAANAAVYTSGSKSCPTGELVVIVATYSGKGTIYYPSNEYRAGYTHSYIYTQDFWTNLRSTTWMVVVGNGTLDDDGTYAECEPSA